MSLCGILLKSTQNLQKYPPARKSVRQTKIRQFLQHGNPANTHWLPTQKFWLDCQVQIFSNQINFSSITINSKLPRTTSVFKKSVTSNAYWLLPQYRQIRLGLSTGFINVFFVGKLQIGLTILSFFQCARFLNFSSEI